MSDILALSSDVPLTLVAPAVTGVVIVGVAVCTGDDTGAGATVVVATELTVSPVPCAVTQILSPADNAGTVMVQSPAEQAVVV